VCGKRMVIKRKVQLPKCTTCHRKLADEKRKVEKICAYCGSIFSSRRGNYCSQRCVNLGGRWKTNRLQSVG
jgi:predicted RNA-binding Zn-ribbon protein involved in translation (DUF1610 family)